MATRVILIDYHAPQHWDYAKRNGFWDLQKHWNGLGPGDTVYFRTTGSQAAFLGRARVTTEQQTLADDVAHAWSSEDSRRGGYRYRIGLTDFEDLPVVRLSWSEVVQGTSAPRRLNPVTLIPESGVPWLERRLGITRDPYAQALNVVREDHREDLDVELMVEDRRVRVPASVVLRRGRGPFRDALLEAYDRRCAVTGASTEGVLEAAHICDYRGDHTDSVSNGVLLRADIHTLFDLKLLTIGADDARVRIAPEVQDSSYRMLDGRPISVPTSATQRPAHAYLAAHNSACSWYHANGGD
ncbi:HNH endonuclease [Knoellia remsis]|nr:HNH endonuclease [Knoellia remsis]